MSLQSVFTGKIFVACCAVESLRMTIFFHLVIPLCYSYTLCIMHKSETWTESAKRMRDRKIEWLIGNAPLLASQFLDFQHPIPTANREKNTPKFGWKCHETDAWSTGQFPHPFARSLAPLTHSLALIHLLARSLTCFGAHGKEVFVYEKNASISYSFNSLFTGRC